MFAQIEKQAEKNQNEQEFKHSTLTDRTYDGIIKAREQFAISLRKKKKNEILKLKRKKLITFKEDQPIVQESFKILSIQSYMVYLGKLEALAKSKESDDQVHALQILNSFNDLAIEASES